jgi:crossover junction endodeoxyribonuclease RuvC
MPTLAPTLVLGIDPGLEHTGYGVISVAGNRYTFVGCGRINTAKTDTLAQRLVALEEGLAEVIATFKPTCAAVEETFVNVNARSSLILGHARGVCLMVPQKAGVPVHEYAARLVKKSLVGIGKAEKEQVAHMVKVLLPGANPSSPDAADALALALTHAHHMALLNISTKA